MTLKCDCYLPGEVLALLAVTWEWRPLDVQRVGRVMGRLADLDRSRDPGSGLRGHE